jgi:hypothetical protein
VTPSQLYAREPESTSSDLSSLRGFSFDHVPEIQGDLFKEDPVRRVIVRVYKHFNFDERRYWRLASVWYP